MKSNKVTANEISDRTGMVARQISRAICKYIPHLIICIAAPFFFPSNLHAQSFAETTHLIDVRAGSDLTQKVRKISYGGYELSDGTPVSFSTWYTSNWTDLSLTWITEINRNFGVYWGLSTGESGPKYRIQPGLKIGFLLQSEITRSGTLSLSATTILAGMLTENTCIADYGAIGGVQTVNCRLAASTLPPAETLQHLFNDPPSDKIDMVLRYQLRF